MKQGTKDEVTLAELEVLRFNLEGVQTMCHSIIRRVDRDIARVDKLKRQIEEPATA